MPNREVAGFAWFWEGLDQYLESMGLKQTQQRRLIVQQFLELNRHVDADELFREMNQKGHEIGLATIYRTLNLLVEARLVDQKTFQDGRAVFEVSYPNVHHDHLLCTRCGRVEEFEDHDIERIQMDIAKRFGISLKTHRLDLYGVCSDIQMCDERIRLK